jgi:hypothetical protein
MDNSDTTSINENFYIVLPSNGCPLTQPNNHASSYIIDWETAISLKGKWEVALTEFSIVNVPEVSKKPSSIEYTIIQNKKEKCFMIVTPTMLVLNTITSQYFSMFQLPTGHVEFSSKKIPFKIIFDSIIDAKNLGFLDSVIECTTDKIITPNKTDVTKLYTDLKIYKSKQKVGQKNEGIEFFFNIEYMELERIRDAIFFREPLAFPTPELLCSFILTNCSTIFEVFQVNNNGFISFKLKPNIDDIEFSPIIKTILGFDESIFQSGRIKYAENKPYTEKTFNQMYIYSSLVDPIMVGGVYVPLLRSIWVESKYNYGDIVHKNVKNKMYLPVSSTSINNIEIEIRNDAGELIPFPYGSKTNLTLHLKSNG